MDIEKLDKDRLLAFEMKCYRWILLIWWLQKVRNEEVKKRIGANRNVFQIIIQRKLQFFGHICQMKDARMLKAIVFGVMEGKARKGRPCREWTDNITDWCKEDLHTLRWKATDRAEW